MKQYRSIVLAGFLASVVMFQSAAAVEVAKVDKAQVKAQAATTISPQAQAERDQIFSLLAYAVVLKDWQTGGPNQRGHNIGSVLVDPQGNVVFWARNCNQRTKDGTQHGEVRLMLGYLEQVHSYSLSGYTVYTSLEPCAQCSGMMVLQSIARTVYGQTDPSYGKAIERLKFNSTACGGYPPYPRPVISDLSTTDICGILNAQYAQYQGSITDYLLSPQAKLVYQQALKELQTFQVKNPENVSTLKQCLNFLNTQVNSDYVIVIQNASHAHK